MSRRLLALAALFFIPLFVAASSLAEAQTGDRAKARAHAKQAKAHFDAGDYARAAAEYQAAYDLDRRPSRIYNLAACHDRLGDKARALELYRKYLELDPNGQGAHVAAEAVAAIEAQLADEKRLKEAEAAEAQKRAEAAETQKRADAVEAQKRAEADRLARERERERRGETRVAGAFITPPPARPAAEVADERGEVKRRRPLWLSLAIAAVATGLALDFIPDSSTNGSFEATDMLPLGCYALGATFLAVWTF